MNQPQPTPPPQKKGLSGLAVAGIGCGALLLLGGIAGGLVIMKGYQKLKEVTGDLDFEKNPAKSAALMALRLNPELEIVTVNDATGEVTVKEKKSGDTVTMSFEDIAQGKFTIKNSKGETVTMDASNAEKQGVVVNGPEGQTVIGGTQSAPPEWVLVYPGASHTGGMRNERGKSVNGSYAMETTDKLEKASAYYSEHLKADGYELNYTTTTSSDGNISMISGTKDNGKRTLTVMIQGLDGKTHIALSYSLDAGN
jgi:hypothetical protein